MDWWTQNKDAITAIGVAITAMATVVGTIWAIFKWGFFRRWQRRLRVNVNVFEVITDPNILLRKLYATENDDTPLADHNITYQPRDPNRDIQSELKAALNRSRYLLITAPTGYGKTREAGVLAQTMMLEGWRVLRIKNTGWLDTPKTLPLELENNRSRILIFLDDLNGLFSVGERTESPRAEKIALLNEPSYHDRLLQVLEMFEGMCTKSEIRVLATARSEAEQWKLLNFNLRDRLWSRFERVEITEPVDAAIARLLENCAKEANLKAKYEDFLAIAHKNDGSYRNILLNLRRWQAKNNEIDKDDFNETLNGSWKDIYQQVIKKYPAAKYIYDAMDIMRQAGMELYLSGVEATAVAIWGGNAFQKIIHMGKIFIASNYLTKETRILRQMNDVLIPSDGQIEAKGTTLTLQNFHQHTNVLIEYMRESFSPDKNIVGAVLLSFGLRLVDDKRKDDAIRIWREIPANNRFFYFSQYLAYYYSNNYDQAIEFLQNLPRKQKKKAMNIQFLLGSALEKLGRFTEAESAYREAIKLNPSNANLYVELGDLLSGKGLQRYTEAEISYRKAVELDPLAIVTYKKLIRILRFNIIDGEKDALYFLEKLIKINPDDFRLHLAIASISKQLKQDDSDQHLEKARQHIPEDEFYNRACLESVCDNSDLAFEYLEKAKQEDKFDPPWAWDDPDLQWIRDDPRFIEIVGPKPENKNSEN